MSMAVDTITATLGTFGIGGASVKDARRADPADPADVIELRTAQAVAIGVSLVIVGLIAADQGSARPFAYWALAIGGALVVFEVALRADPEG